MVYQKRALEELDIIDNFLMDQLVLDETFGEDFCRRILSSLLQREIRGKLQVRAQKSLPAAAPNLRGIRMDVEIEELDGVPDEQGAAVMNIYDLEPHLRDDLNLPKHNRFYQAKIDNRGLRSGERDFTKLPNLYILTILNYDPFGRDYMMYTIRNQCEELPDLKYEDRLRFCYFYTGGKKGGNERLRTLLTYIQDSRTENATDAATKELHDYVSRAKILPEVKQAYMTFEDFIYYERKDAAKANKKNDILELLEDYGNIPESLKERLQETDDPDVLKKWHKLAAKANSIEEFMKKISG